MFRFCLIFRQKLPPVVVEEGGMHLLLHLPIDEENEDRWCLWRPDQDVMALPFCRPFDPKKKETQAARMADWFYVVGLSQDEEIARREPGHVHRFLIELICKEHLNPNFYAYHLKSLACEVAVSAELKLYGNQISARDIGFQDAETISRDRLPTNLGHGETVSSGCRFWRLP